MGQLCGKLDPITCTFNPWWFNAASSTKRLPSMNAHADTITFSGFSSGSFMSTNMHVIYSDIIKGVGLTSGGVYGFANYGTQFDPFTGDEDARLTNVIADTEALADDGRIAAVSNLQSSPVSIIGGDADTSVPPALIAYVEAFYHHF